MSLLSLPTGEQIYRFADIDNTGSIGFDFNATDVNYRFYDWDTTSGLAELTGITHAGYDTNGIFNVATSLTRSGGSPWGTEQSGHDTEDLASDVHGSTIDSNGSDLAAGADYTAWGEASSGAEPSPKLGYRGEVLIGGLLNLRARDYDPETGIFTTTDPIEGVAGTTVRNNPYHYSNNSPLNLVDPAGLQPGDPQLRAPGKDFEQSLTNLAKSYARATLGPRTVGGCLGGVIAGWGVLASDSCIVDDGSAISIVETGIFGISTPSIAAEAGFIYSNARPASKLGGSGACVSIGTEFIPLGMANLGLTAQVCIGSKKFAPTEIADLSDTITVFAGVSGAVEAGPGGFIGYSSTSVRKILDYPECLDDGGSPQLLPVPRPGERPPFFSPPKSRFARRRVLQVGVPCLKQTSRAILPEAYNG